MIKTIYLNGDSLTIHEFIDVVFKKCPVEITDDARKKIDRAAAAVAEMVSKEKVVYGITTGFGQFSNVSISSEKVKKLQRNLIVSHATGVGNILDEQVTRGIILLRMNALCQGFSGIRFSTLQILQKFLNKNLLPCIPQKGSVGSSGDLAPLAHMVLPMLGLGEAVFDGKTMSGEDAMKKAGIDIIELDAKEGLALINGTQVMTSVGLINLIRAKNLWHHANMIAAMSVESLDGTDSAYDHKIHDLRPHPGQRYCAKEMTWLCKDSEIVQSHRNCSKVQDAYSLRCIPQVHGATWDTIQYVEQVLINEMNAVTDNPLIFIEQDQVISGGNFHGQPVALAMDFLGIAVSELSNISERRIERLVNASLSENLPAFLTEEGGLNSGFMITQYTAASLVSENKVLAHPSSVDSIPTSASQEDHVSMGTIGAMKCAEIIKNVRWVLSIEALCAAQALDFKQYRSGQGTRIVHETIRKHIEHLTEDRIMYTDIKTMSAVIETQEILKNIDKKDFDFKFYEM